MHGLEKYLILTLEVCRPFIAASRLMNALDACLVHLKLHVIPVQLYNIII